MQSFLLLYLATYIPVSAGPYTPAIKTAREAAFVQSGIKTDFELVRRAGEKRVPPLLQHAAVIGVAASKKEIRFKSSDFGTWSFKKNSVQMSWGFSW